VGEFKFRGGDIHCGTVQYIYARKQGQEIRKQGREARN
jgi:hypothetical protein